MYWILKLLSFQSNNNFQYPIHFKIFFRPTYFLQNRNKSRDNSSIFMARAPIPYNPQPNMKFLGIPLHPAVSDMNGMERNVCYAWTFYKRPKCVKSAQ